MPNEKSMDFVYEKYTNQILQIIEEGKTLPWEKPWTSIWHKNISGREYKGINPFMLDYAKEKNHFTSNIWISLKQTLDMKRRIKKEEFNNSEWIVFWKFFKVKDKDNTDKTKTIPFIRYYKVYNFDQTEGIELPKKFTEMHIINNHEEADKIVEGFKDKPPIYWDATDRAFYRISEDAIHVQNKDTFKTQEGYYATLFHELIHSTGAKKRLNRDLDNWVSTDMYKYNKEELVAEFGSCFLMAKCQMNNENEFRKNADYIKGWSNAFKQDKKLLISAASKAQKASDYILGITYEQQQKQQEE